MKVLLDTCACLFFAEESDRLSGPAYDLITHRNSEVFISAVTSAELACLSQKRRLKLSTHWKLWLRQQLEVNDWICKSVTLEVLEEAWSLPEPIHADPADRIIIATARLERMTVVTTDSLILDYPHVVSLR